MECQLANGAEFLVGAELGGYDPVVRDDALIRCPRTRRLNHGGGLEREHEALAGTGDMKAVLEMLAAGDEGARLAFDVYIHRLRGCIAAMVAGTASLHRPSVLHHPSSMPHSSVATGDQAPSVVGDVVVVM